MPLEHPLMTGPIIGEAYSLNSNSVEDDSNERVTRSSKGVKNTEAKVEHISVHRKLLPRIHNKKCTPVL